MASQKDFHIPPTAVDRNGNHSSIAQALAISQCLQHSQLTARLREMSVKQNWLAKADQT